MKEKKIYAAGENFRISTLRMLGGTFRSVMHARSVLGTECVRAFFMYVSRPFASPISRFFLFHSLPHKILCMLEYAKYVENIFFNIEYIFFIPPVPE